MDKHIERRKHQRFLLNTDALIKQLDNQKSLEVLAVDVNERGVGFYSETKVKEGTACSVSLMYNGNGPSDEEQRTESVNGEVKWCIDDGEKIKIGLEFNELLTEKTHQKFFECLNTSVIGNA